MYLTCISFLISPGKLPIAFSLQHFHLSGLGHVIFNDVSPTLTALSEKEEGLVHQRKIEGQFLGEDVMLDR